MDLEEYKEVIALEDLWGMSPGKRLAYLKKQWELDDECVYGQLKEHVTGKYCILYNVKNINNKLLEYPFDDKEMKNIHKRVNKFGIFAGLPKYINIPFGHLVKTQILISKPEECERYNNPLLVEIKSPEVVTFIPNSFVIRNSFGDVILEETIKNHILKTKIPEIDENISEREKSLEEKENEIFDTNERINSLNEKLKSVNDEISDGNGKKEQFKKDINEEIKKLHRIKNDCKLERQEEFASLEIVKKETRQKIMQLKEYVQSKADFLHDLKLISKDQLDSLTGNTEPTSVNDKPRLDFTKDLNGEFEKLIFQIQTYLYSQGKYYSKSVLENFLTLLRTNDLIIISGASGTGKSYLVKSFAQSIGGVAKIIPVKPNWTSSEDLLGYYNPMQKSYMSTQFLDAIVAAKRDPNRLHLICLDEMNLARVEYYFADFLSVLEEREKTPIINLYSREEAEHIKSEFRTIIDIFEESRSGLPNIRFTDFGDFLHHKEITRKLQEIFGNSESNSLVDLYGKVRRMVGGVLNIPAEFEFPDNIRIIGTINIDQTTHYFAPKVLDRSYLLKFESPLENIDLVEKEVEGMDEIPNPVYLHPSDFGSAREPYPKFDSDNAITRKIGEWNKEFLSPLGIEVGMRVMRQALLFQNLYKDLQAGRTDQLFNSDILNIILLTKILPHFMFDGDKNGIKDNNQIKKHDLVKQFAAEIANAISETVKNNGTNNALKELQRMIRSAEDEHNDKIYNYWA